MAFHALAKTNELVDGFRRAIRLPGLALLIFHHEGKLHIIEDRCPHMDVPLSDAKLEGAVIRCVAHGIGFDLGSGRAEGMWSDTLQCIKRFEAVYRDYSVGIELPDLIED